MPLFKSSEDWKLSLKGLCRLSVGRISELSDSGGRGLDYEDYLRLMLLATSNDKKYARLAGLMEGNIRCMDGYGNFCISNCITGVTVSCSCRIDNAGRYRTTHVSAY